MFSINWTPCNKRIPKCIESLYKRFGGKGTKINGNTDLMTTSFDFQILWMTNYIHMYIGFHNRNIVIETS